MVGTGKQQRHYLEQTVALSYRLHRPNTARIGCGVVELNCSYRRGIVLKIAIQPKHCT